MGASKSTRIDFDTYGHLYYINELRCQGRSAWAKIKIKCWAGENFSHPFLLHSLLSFIPKKTLLKYQRFINVVLDSAFCLVVYATSEIIFKKHEISLVCVLLYLFTPMWFSKISMGPRINTFTPRLFTELVFNILICLLIGLYHVNKFEFILYSVLLFIIIILTSKFGLQMVFFSVPLISLFLLDIWPFALSILALIIIFIISKGDVYNLFKRQFIHLLEYYKTNLKGKTSISNRNMFVKIRRSDFSTRSAFRKLIYNYLFFNSHTSVI